MTIQLSGKPTSYWVDSTPETTHPQLDRDLSVDEYRAALVAGGLSEAEATLLADSDAGVARGELATDSGHLRALIGRPTTTLAQAVASGLATA